MPHAHMFLARSSRWGQILVWFFSPAWLPPGWWLVRIWASACSGTYPWRRLVRVWSSFLCLFSWRRLIRVWVMPLLDPFCPWWRQWIRFFIWQSDQYLYDGVLKWNTKIKFRFAIYLIFPSVALEVINPESHDGLSWGEKHLESHGGSSWVGICLESHGVSSWQMNSFYSSCSMGQAFGFEVHFHSPHLCLLFHQLLEEDTHHKHNML